MRKIFTLFLVVLVIFGFMSFGTNHAEARGRTGSIRIGGYNSHGKGSHYIGGYLRY